MVALILSEFLQVVFFVFTFTSSVNFTGVVEICSKCCKGLGEYCTSTQGTVYIYPQKKHRYFKFYQLCPSLLAEESQQYFYLHSDQYSPARVDSTPTIPTTTLVQLEPSQPRNLLYCLLQAFLSVKNSGGIVCCQVRSRPGRRGERIRISCNVV